MGVKRPGRQADHSHLSSAEVKNDGAIPPLPHTSSCTGTTLLFLCFGMWHLVTYKKFTDVSDELAVSILRFEVETDQMLLAFRFIRTISTYLPNYTSSHPTRPYLKTQCHEKRLPLFEKCLVPISAGTQAALSKDFPAFSQSKKANARMTPPSGYNRFLPSPFQFIIHQSLHYPSLRSFDTDQSVLKVEHFIPRFSS
jgi:hypothetical protein